MGLVKLQVQIKRAQSGSGMSRHDTTFGPQKKIMIQFEYLTIDLSLTLIQKINCEIRSLDPLHKKFKSKMNVYNENYRIRLFISVRISLFHLCDNKTGINNKPILSNLTLITNTYIKKPTEYHKIHLHWIIDKIIPNIPLLTQSTTNCLEK